MWKAKQLLMAAVVAASTLMVGVTPRPAAAEVMATAVVLLPDGEYAVYENGRLIGYITVRAGVIVSSRPPR